MAWASGKEEIIVPRGQKMAKKISAESRSAVTAAFTISADGDLLSPFIVYKAVNLAPNWKNATSLNIVCDVSNSGWMNADLFLKWFQLVSL